MYFNYRANDFSRQNKNESFALLEQPPCVRDASQKFYHMEISLWPVFLLKGRTKRAITLNCSANDENTLRIQKGI